MCFGGCVVPWTRNVGGGRDLLRRGLQAANKMGDLVYAACGHHLTTNLLATGEPLVDVQREAENGLAFAQKARFEFIIDIAATQLELIRTLRGLTPTFGSFDDGQFEELRIERRFPRSPDLQAECSYLIRKLQARFFAGDYRAAVEASSRAQSLLWTLASHFETAEYHFYGALSRAASCDSAPAAERQQHMEALAAHHKQLQVWAANCPDNFENRAALVGAEIARIEGRELDADASTNRPSARLAQTALFTMRRSPMNWLPASTRRVASRRSPVCICRTPATAIRVGEPMARCGNSNSFIRISATHQSLHLPPLPLARPSSSWMSGRCSRPRRRCPARSASASSSRRSCGSRSSMPAPTVACSSCSRATSHGSWRQRRPAAARLRSRSARRPCHRR